MRLSERERGGVTRPKKTETLAYSLSRDVGSTDETTVGQGSCIRRGEVLEFSAIIDFQLIPSGRVRINRESREHIVDFFQSSK